MDLGALLNEVLAELEESTGTEPRALLHRLRAGTHTRQDASEVADMIEALVERVGKPGTRGRHN